MPGKRSALAAAALVAGVLSISAASCASRRDPTLPAPDLAEAERAGQAFDTLRRRFATASREDRISLEGHVELLKRWFPGDPTNRVADVLLAWIALEKGDTAGARARVVEIVRGDPGNTRDLATLVTGAALTRDGEPDEALTLLLPLVGKLIDPFARDLLHDEAVKASVAASRWRDAVDLLDAWLRDVPQEDRATVLEIATRTLEKLPAPTLEAALRDMAAEDEAGTAPHAAALEAAIARRLGAVALSRSDAELARRLVRQGGALANLGAHGRPVVELAAAGGGAPRVVGHRMGLLSSTRDVRASAEALGGIMQALGLVGAAAAADGEALAVADDEAGAAAGVASLVRGGAVVVLGGFDEEGARALREAAASEQVPAVLLAPGGDGDPGWVRTLGPDPARALDLLRRELGSDATPPRPVVVLSRSDCATLAPTAGAPSPIVPSGAGIVVGGDALCARRASLAFRGPIALGLLGAGAAMPPDRARSPAREAVTAAAWLGLGCYPSVTARSYWAALTEDAARLAARAAEGLPRTTTADPKEIARRREAVREGLGRAGPSRCLGLTLDGDAHPEVRRPGDTPRIGDEPGPNPGR